MPAGGWGERFVAAAAAVVAGWSALIACGGFVTQPAQGCYSGAITVTCNVVRVTVTTDGPFTLEMNGRGIQSTTATVYDVYDVPLGSNLITGTTSAGTMTILLSSVATATGGVVQRASLSTESGPGASVSACSVTYTIPGGGARPQTFRARYVLQTGSAQC